MQLSTIKKTGLKDLIPVTLAVLRDHSRENCLDDLENSFSPDELTGVITAGTAGSEIDFVSDLARLELAKKDVEKDNYPDAVESVVVNPTLRILDLSWTGVDRVMERGSVESALLREEPGYLLVYKNGKNEIVSGYAKESDLLALKIVLENPSREDLERESGLKLKAVEDIIDDACGKGILIKPVSLIARDPSGFSEAGILDGEFFVSEYFTLQWHITQVCDLHCRHCYDRSDRSPLPLERGIEIIDEFREFCDSRNVRGQISFTGGNPLLHPDFMEFYAYAAGKGLLLAILGNPASRKNLEELMAVQEPEFYQISIEGLKEHNDSIRGRGHFKSATDFLSLLKELKIYSIVMLTLTGGNMDQVIPLANFLRERTDRFTFNRLSLFGEGAGLSLPDGESYMKFLDEYLSAAEENPHMGLKDNLFNIFLHNRGEQLSSGCAGFGCGAAFNFVSLLPDGEVHACRKLPSLIGNINKTGLAEIYDSDLAGRYRSGTSACKTCSLRPVCGGCPAVTSSFGLDIFNDRDPNCFLHRL
jgi:selenobiotic family peptide radical SAM maturase